MKEHRNRHLSWRFWYAVVAVSVGVVGFTVMAIAHAWMWVAVFALLTAVNVWVVVDNWRRGKKSVQEK